MGILSSKDTRRISFDNTFALSPIKMQKSREDSDILINDNDLSTESDTKLFFQEIEKPVTLLEDSELDYWAKRIDSLKKEHEIINEIIKTDYESKIESSNYTYHQPKVTHERFKKIKPCFDWRVKIVKCYEDNPQQPLVCSDAVDAFSKCVAACRMEE